MERRVRTLAVALLALVALAGVGLAITGGVGVSGTVTIDAPSGPSVDVVTNGGELLLDGPAGPNTVEVTHDNGEVVFESTGSTQATVDTTEITGDYTRVTGIDASNDLTITPEDKPGVTVAGGTDSVEFSSMAVDDGTRDFSYSASSSASMTVNQIGATNETVIAVAGDGTVLDQTTADSSGSATFSSLGSGTYDVTLATTSDPALSGATPSGGDTVSETPVQLSINVSDGDFPTSQGDSVDVTFYDASDDSTIGTDTLASNGTATASWDSIQGGSNDWYAVASDSYGNDVTSQTFTFNAPSDLEIRDLETQELITTDSNGDPVNVEVQFFGDEGAVAQRNTTDGTISLEGLPVDERFAVSVDAGDEYVERRILITSLIDHQTAYLLNSTSTEIVRPRFILEDPSNQFDTEESEIILERPIETENGTRFVPVTGDRIGLNGFDTALESGQRYRVFVRDPESGTQRRLGEFTPTTSEQVRLTVQDVEFDSVSDVDGLEWTARYISNEEQADEIEFIYRDTFDVQSLDYSIVERGNASNVLASGSADGNVTVSEPVPANESDTVWRVEWEATRTGGDTLDGSRVVSSDKLPVGPGLAPEWQTVVSVVALFVIAGLFGAANPGVGGIAVASTGGFLFFLGWLPDSTGGLMVILALFVAVLSYAARKARGASA